MDCLREIFVNGASEAKVPQILTDIGGTTTLVTFTSYFVEFSVLDGKIRPDNCFRQPVPDSWLKPLSLRSHDVASAEL